MFQAQARPASIRRTSAERASSNSTQHGRTAHQPGAAGQYHEHQQGACFKRRRGRPASGEPVQSVLQATAPSTAGQRISRKRPASIMSISRELVSSAGADGHHHEHRWGACFQHHEHQQQTRFKHQRGRPASCALAGSLFQAQAWPSSIMSISMERLASIMGITSEASRSKHLHFVPAS